MRSLLLAIKRMFRRKKTVHIISRLPVCEELTAQEKDQLYGVSPSQEKRI